MSISSSIKSAAAKVRAWLIAAALAVAGWFGYQQVAEPQVVTDVVSWTLPTQRTDNSPLPVSQIAKTTIAWGTAPGGPYPNIQDVTAPATTHTFTRPSPGTGPRCYVAYVTDTDGRVGGQSTEACKTVVAAPRQPTNLTVE